jgi:hypothetical protein
MIDNMLVTGPVGDVLLFSNDHTSLRIERAANGTFDLVLSAHGEEVTAYDLTAETVTAIGTQLVTVACVPTATVS